MAQSLKSKPSSSILKDTRVAKGLTLEIVHEATKIPLDALRAIEEGYSTKMLTPFYYRGFIKIYAEFLGLNVAEVFKEYHLQPPAPPMAGLAPTVPSGLAKSVIKTPSPTRPVLKEPNMFVFQVQEFWRHVWIALHRKRILQVMAVMVALVLVVKLVGTVATFFKSLPKTSKVVAVVKLKATKKKEPALVRPVAPLSAVSENHRVTLTVHAPKNSWIQVKTDGEVVFEMTMKKGTIENWEAKKTIELSGRNISDLDLEVNGKHIGTLSSSNRRAKRVIITKEGLIVKK